MAYRSRWILALSGIVLGTLSTAHAADPNNGGSLYGKHCLNCHGDNGMGMMPGTPNFSRGEGLFKPDSEIATVIRSGRAVMPAFEGMLSESDIYDVIAYLRTMR